MSRYVTVDEVASEIAHRPQKEGAAWFADWIQRRDEMSAEIAADKLADALETLAVELRGEANHELTGRTKGLILAAAVLLDTAGGVRIGDTVTTQ